MKETKRWLTDEVFVQYDKGMEEVDEEQQAFEDELLQAISGETNDDRHRRALAVRAFRGLPDEENE